MTADKPPQPGSRKQRLDTILVERGFFSSRSRAAAAVMAGQVTVGGRKDLKAGSQVAPDAEIQVARSEGYVSRGGLKLERAFAEFDFDVAGRTALDAGASTGGFTDCLLRHGAAGVVAVDVGYGQLDWGLRGDRRVTVLERTNARYLTAGMLPYRPEVATLDLSFISLKKVLNAVIKCLSPGFEIVALVKPQFEAGRGQVGKGGVVREPEVHRRVLREVWDFAEASGCRVLGLTDSGVPGPSGNIEYLIHLREKGRTGPRGHEPDRDETIDRVVGRLEEGLRGGRSG
ncbi:MAG: TlyA family RNA methyltransferase [Gaiellales bacterium]|nr:MAG: TlyA family RNA methyltransferase [Gaiellales bacterium]